MACTITDFSVDTTCSGDEGGVIKTFYTKLENISAITVASGIITGFTMASTGLWKTLVYDKDDTAYFNQVGARANGRYSVTQTAFLKFKGLQSTHLSLGNAIKDCCSIVAIHVASNGTRMVQGIEIDASATGGFRSSRKETRITPTANTDTGANQSRLELTIEGEANELTTTTDLTDTEILAL
jgi:hypothetical protein